MRRIAFRPQNESSAEYDSIHGTGGARDHTQESGVPHFPSQMYAERPSAISFPPGFHKAVIIRKVNDKLKGPKDFLKICKDRLGEGFVVNHKFKRILSEKFPNVEVWAALVTVRENLADELTSLAGANNAPVLILKPRKKKSSIQHSVFELELVSLLLK